MGVIQSAINQTIGTIGLAARLSPGYETRVEMHKLKKQDEALTNMEKQLPTDPALSGEGTVVAKQREEIAKKQSEIAQRRFELKPGKETARTAILARSGAGEGSLATLPADPDEILMEQQQIQANQEAAEQAEARLRQQQRYNEFVNLFTEGGRYR